MCGIIGYTGAGNAIPKITKGLSVLEYRGYDSVGLAARTENGITTVKCRGRIQMLEEKLATEQYGVGFLLGNVDLRDKIQETLNEMAEDGTLAKIAEEWGLTDSICMGK